MVEGGIGVWLCAMMFLIDVIEQNLCRLCCCWYVEIDTLEGMTVHLTEYY